MIDSGSLGRSLVAGLAAVACLAQAQDKSLGEVRSEDGKVRVAVLSLKRIEGNLVTLRWQIFNDSQKNASVTPGNMRLVDLAGRREYQPGLMSSLCVANPGEKLQCWATFAAPPAGTRTMAVKFYEPFDLLTGIPVSD